MADSKSDKKNSVKVGVLNEPKSSNPHGKELLAKAAEAPKAVEPAEDVAPALVISSLNNPEIVKYGDDQIRISPRSRVRVADAGLLQNPLPVGLYLKRLS